MKQEELDSLLAASKNGSIVRGSIDTQGNEIAAVLGTVRKSGHLWIVEDRDHAHIIFTNDSKLHIYAGQLRISREI